MEEIELYLEEATELMDKAIKHTAHELTRIRAGKATPSMLEGVRVEYYGAETPINQISSITTPDARTIMIKPFERSVLGAIEKAIINSDLGLNPQNDGEQVFLHIPMLTEQRRLELVKQVKHEIEHGKISIRNVRKEINDSLKKLQKEGVSEDDVKRAEDQVQKITDNHIKMIDDLFVKKEADIMKV